MQYAMPQWRAGGRNLRFKSLLELTALQERIQMRGLFEALFVNLILVFFNRFQMFRSSPIAEN